MSSVQAPCSVGELWKVFEFRSGKLIAAPEEDLPVSDSRKDWKAERPKTQVNRVKAEVSF